MQKVSTKKSRTPQEFIKKRPYLIWYVKDLDNLSNESIVEHTLNYGDWDDVLELIEIMSVDGVAKIFRKESSRPRCNYRPEIRHYFNLYFDKYASGGSHREAKGAPAIA